MIPSIYCLMIYERTLGYLYLNYEFRLRSVEKIISFWDTSKSNYRNILHFLSQAIWHYYSLDCLKIYPKVLLDCLTQQLQLYAQICKEMNARRGSFSWFLLEWAACVNKRQTWTYAEHLYRCDSMLLWLKRFLIIMALFFEFIWD